MFSGYNKTLDLGSTLVDLIYFGVPHQLFNWIFSVESVATKNLDCYRPEKNEKDFQTELRDEKELALFLPY